MDMTPLHIAIWRDKRNGTLHIVTYVCEALYISDLRLASAIIAMPWDRAHTITYWIRKANWLTDAERAHAIRQATDLLAVYDITPTQD